MTATQADKGEVFRGLHEGEPFVIPNPWDAGSAKTLTSLGFKALATTSAGLAETLGRLDSNVTLDELSDHVADLATATDLPISVDLENGFGPQPDDAAKAITRAAEAGAVGGSIEDWDPADGRLYSIEHATERIAAAAEAAQGLGFTFTLTGRAENHLRGNPDLDDTIARLKAYGEAGADVLYAPWLRTSEEIKAVCDAVPKPVNVLARPDLTSAQVFEAGAQRISLGSWLAMAALAAAVEVATKIRDEGDFSSLPSSVPLAEWLGA